RVVLPNDAINGQRVPPGKIVTFPIPARAPTSLGGALQSAQFSYQWRLVRETPDTLFRDTSANESVTVTGRDRAGTGTISPPLDNVPASGDACAVVTTSMTNNGTTTWTKVGTAAAPRYQGRYRLFNTNGTLRTQAVVDLTSNLPPGGPYTFPGATLCAPD